MANNNLKTLLEIFNNKLFRIPDYQRGYAWTKKQLEDFWSDLENLNNNKIHYTGMITVEAKDNNTYYVIDGQQRLTTIIILLKVLLDNYNDEWIGDDNGYEKEDLIKTFLYKKTGKQQKITIPIFGYEKDNPSDCYFKQNILNINDSNCNSINESIYTKNLLNTKQFFEKKIKSFNQEKIEKLILKILKQLKFNLYELDNELDEFVTFEVMNNRGKPLTTLELLKNRLIYLSTLFKNYSDNEISKLRNDINNSWKIIYEYLGKNPQKIIKDDDFLKDHWIMYFTYDRNKANAEKEFLLEKYFTQNRVLLKYDVEKLNLLKEINKNIKELILDYSDIENYVENIQKAVKTYFYMLNPEKSQYDDEIKEWLKKLNIIGFRAFKPLIIAVLMEYNNLDKNKILEVLKLAELYVFLVFIISKRRGDTGNSRFYKYANEFHKNKNIDILIENIENEIYEDENSYRWVNIENFIEEIDFLFKHYKGWYDWKYLNYFLYEYEIYLQKQNKGNGIKIHWQDINKESIEHIYPERATLDCWKKIFKINKKNYLHSLGNLLLLSSSKNSSLGNKCFKDKKEKYKTGSYSEIEVSQYKNWSQKEIYKRGLKLLDFLSERWDIDISNEQKEKLLNIDRNE
jgi:hypothetical protein